MKKFILLLFYLLFSLSLPAFTSDFERTLLGLKMDRTQFSNQQFTGVGIAAELFFTKNFSGQYSLLFGKSNTNENYWYAGIGQAAAYYSVSTIARSNFRFGSIQLMILAMVLPETFNYSIDVNEKTRLTFFLSPYGYEYRKNPKTKEEKQSLSFELGIKGYSIKSPGGIKIIPQIGIKKLYDTFDRTAVTAGISVMWYRGGNYTSATSPGGMGYRGNDKTQAFGFLRW